MTSILILTNSNVLSHFNPHTSEKTNVDDPSRNENEFFSVISTENKTQKSGSPHPLDPDFPRVDIPTLRK